LALKLLFNKLSAPVVTPGSVPFYYYLNFRTSLNSLNYLKRLHNCGFLIRGKFAIWNIQYI